MTELVFSVAEKVIEKLGMGAVVLFNVSAGIIEKMGDLTVQEIGLHWGVKHEIEKLSKTVSAISAVLLDAEKKQWNSEVKQWLTTLKDPIYEADDLVDDIFTEASRLQQMTRNKMPKEVRIFFSKSNQLVYGFEMGHKVKAVRERLDAVAADRTFYLEERLEETQVCNRVRERIHSSVRPEVFFGRENAKKEVIEHLLDANTQDNVSVLSILGMPGIGKTALANHVYDDEEINKHFELKLWVCVSVGFDLKVIVKKILESATNQKLENLEMSALRKDLKKEIDGKRYLLVLDDVWDEDSERWISLKRLLMSGAKGSKILVITRIDTVAMMVGGSSRYSLSFLGKQESWSLFKHVAFENGKEPANLRIKEIGMKILDECKGNPLSIRIIGSLLYFENLEKEWSSIMDNELPNLCNNNHSILQSIIEFSYDHLPSYLKPCVAYCCLFPMNHKFHKPTLIKMWMAQGFIRRSSQNQCLEDVGHEYFMELLWRSFFQEVEKDKWGNILHFKIHGFVHDFALSVAGYDFNFYSHYAIIHVKTRHVSFRESFISSLESTVSLFEASKIRTVLLPSDVEFEHISLDMSAIREIVANFKFLRLLDLHDSGIKVVPSFITKLKHLRYLDLSQNIGIKMLPESINRLQNLQTLRLSGCSKLKELPRNINKLVNLRYLEIDGCQDLSHMPHGLAQLTNLLTLSRFVISNSRSYGGLKELHNLNELRGRLEIAKLRHGKDVALESKATNLKEKKLLQYLKLEWIEEDIDEADVGYDDISLEALQPHPNLKGLGIYWFGGVRFSSWLLSLTNLVQLTFHGFKKCQNLPSLDQLHSLKVLTLCKLDSLEYILEGDHNEELSDSSVLPSLEHLTLHDCHNLKGWWWQKRHSIEEVHNCDDITTAITSRTENHSLPSFPLLDYLSIMGCPKLTSLPFFPYLKELRLYHCSLKPLEQTMLMRMINMETPGKLKSTTMATTIASTSSSSSYSSSHVTSSFVPLSKLKSLAIGELEELEIEWKGLGSLRILQFSSFSKLVFLPAELQHATHLQRLIIENCPSLTAIPEWIHNFTSLRSLDIRDSPNLTLLPEGMRGLTSLQSLEISNCPILLQRCRRGIGEDWLKIAHIPNLLGDLSQLETNSEEDSS